MDTLTHIVAGAVIGELVLGKKVGKKAMLFGALAGNAPDLDALMNFFVSDVDALVLHRGITHSVFVAALVGPILGWSLNRYFRHDFLREWMTLFTINILFHLFLDTCTMYGTGLLMPFSDERFAFNNIFVADPLYTIPLVFSVLFLLILKSGSRQRFIWSRVGVFLSSLYMVSTFYHHADAKKTLQSSLAAQNIVSDQLNVAPTLFNTMLWNVTAATDSGYWTGYVSVFDETAATELYFIRKNISLDQKFTNDQTVQKLNTFSKGFGIISQIGDRTLFHDLRFGQVQGWADPSSTYCFSFDLSTDADNSMVVQQGRILGLQPAVLHSMWNRIRKGPISH
jgi:inner membrane protein